MTYCTPMKKALLVLILSIHSLYALEIQCVDSSLGINITAVTSDESGVTYLVFDDGAHLLNYLGLDPNYILHTDTSLIYEDGTISLRLILGEKGELVSLKPELLLDGTNRELTPAECKFIK